MSTDIDDYTPLPVPAGYVETVNELGETVWRSASLQGRVQSRDHWRKEEFLLLKLSGLMESLLLVPRIGTAALVVLLLTVQRDRTIRQPLKITGALAAKVGRSRHTLNRAAGWLEKYLGHAVAVTRGTGRATRVELTPAGRKLFHPVARKGTRAELLR